MEVTIGMLVELVVQRLAMEEANLLQMAATRQLSRFRREAKHLLELKVVLPDPPRQESYRARSSGRRYSGQSSREVVEAGVDTGEEEEKAEV